jgi:hypothetical protein
MGFLKKIFGSGVNNSYDRDGLYYYIRSKQTGEVIQVRINRHNDLSENESGDGFFTRKTIVGTKSFDRIEAEFYFDARRQLASTDITGGDLVDREAYEAYLSQRASQA